MSLQTIYKTKKIISVTPDATLSSVLAMLSSSHDAAFVFDPSTSSGRGPSASSRSGIGNFLGVINPYHSLAHAANAPGTKVIHCLFHPPRVTVSDPLDRVAAMMIESKIHYLPVFENQNYIGIITARRLIGEVVRTGRASVSVSKLLANKPALVSIMESESIAHAINLFKSYKISKLVVLKKDLRMVGVLTHFDLIPYLSQPRPRQGFSRQGSKTAFLDRPVRDFMKRQVITINQGANVAEVARLILEREIGSVIVIDKSGNPIGIITTRDILSLLLPNRTRVTVEFIPQHLSQASLALATGFVNNINNVVAKFKDITGVKFILKGPPMGGIFEAALSIFTRRGNPTVIKEEGKNLKKVLRQVKKTSKNIENKQ